MAEVIAIPQGVNPNSAIPADAGNLRERSGGGTPGAPGAEGGIPAVPPSSQQQPGFVAPVAGAGDAEYAAFKAWKEAQAGGKPAPVAPVAPVVPVVPESNKTPGFEGMGAAGAMELVKNAAASDPYISATFDLFSVAAPGVDLARALGNAIDRGDPSLIDVAYLNEKGGAQAAKLVEIAKGLVTHVTAAAERVVTDIYAAAGGEAQWGVAAAAFNAQAPQYLKEFVGASLDSANPAKIKSAVDSVLDFVKKNGSVPVAPQGHVRAGGGTPDASLGLSKAEYQAERLKLNPRDRDYADKERELTARRSLGKKSGK